MYSEKRKSLKDRKRGDKTSSLWSWLPAAGVFIFLFALGLQDAESGEYIIVNAILSLPPLASLTAMLILTLIMIAIGLVMICGLGYLAVVTFAVVTRKKKVKWSDL